MKRLARLLPLLLLPLASVPACGGSESSESPTLLVDVTGVPGMALEIYAVVTNGARTSGTVAFYRGPANTFISTLPSSMPPMMMSPSVVALALDLPGQTTGATQVAITVKTGSMQQGAEMVTHGGCGTISVTGGGVFRLSIPLRSPVPTCP